MVRLRGIAGRALLKCVLCLGVVLLAILCFVRLGSAPVYRPRTALLARMLPPFMGEVCKGREGHGASYALRGNAELDYALQGSPHFEHSSRQIKGTLSMKSMSGGAMEARLSQADKTTTRFAFDLDGRCRISRFSFPPSLPVDEQSAIVHLLEEMQFVMPSRAGAQEWEAQETDGLGRQVSHYRVVECGAAECRLEKSKLRYESVAQPLPMPPLQAQIEYSKAEALFGKDIFWLKRAKKEESVRLVNADKVYIKAVLHAELELQQIFSWPAADENTALLPYAGSHQAQTAFHPSAKSAEELERLFANMGWDDAFRSYTAILHEPRAGAKNQAVELLSNYLRYQPTRAQELTAFFNDGSLADEEQAFAFLALQLAGTPEAEQALCTILADSHAGSMNRMRAAIALQDLASPSKAAVDALLQEAAVLSNKTDDSSDDVARTAVLSLGSIADNLRTKDPQLAQQTEESLEQRLAVERDPQNISVLLQSIGNTRNAGLSGTVQLYLNNEDAEVRASAVEAYSKIEGPQQEEILTRQLAEETAPTAKREVYRALARQPVSPLTARSAALRLADEPRSDVRREMILFVGPYAQRDDEVRGALAAQSRRESESGLVLLIGKFLEG